MQRKQRMKCFEELLVWVRRVVRIKDGYQTRERSRHSTSSPGLKTVISEVDPSMGEHICPRILPRLLEMAQSVSNQAHHHQHH